MSHMLCKLLANVIAYEFPSTSRYYHSIFYMKLSNVKSPAQRHTTSKYVAEAELKSRTFDSKTGFFLVTSPICHPVYEC